MSGYADSDEALEVVAPDDMGDGARAMGADWIDPDDEP